MYYKYNICDSVCYNTKTGKKRSGIIQSLITRGRKHFYEIKVEGLKHCQLVEESRVYRFLEENREGCMFDNDYNRRMFKQELEHLMQNMKDEKTCPKYILSVHLKRLIYFFDGFVE